MAIPDLLRGCPLFFELFDPEIEKVVENCHVRRHAKADLIVKDGSRGEEIFIVLSGQAAIQKPILGGAIRVATINEGDVFGEAVLIEETFRTADVIAETPVSVLEIRPAEIFRLFDKDPRIFGILAMNMARILTRRLRTANDVIVRMSEERSFNSTFEGG